MRNSLGVKLLYSSLVALLLTFSATVAFAQDVAPQNTATALPPATVTPVPADTATPVPADTATPVPVDTPVPATPVPPPNEPVQIPEPITVVLFGTGLAALSASVSKRRKNQ